MVSVRRCHIISVLCLAAALGGCASWTGPQKMAYDACIEDWWIYENEAVGPEATVLPRGYDMVEYCLEAARQTRSPALLATAIEAD
jgi:hypothetical protein